MTETISPNTQAILLLTAPLIAGRNGPKTDALTPGEYKRLSRLLREIQRQPADLISADAGEITRACHAVIDEGRLQRLLGRGFLLSQVVERWRARAIWVVSRADDDYPRRLKARLREDAPAVLYGCGDIRQLENGGLAVVGSRQVDETLIDYTMSIGRLAARAGRPLISGGAKGVDQAAMRGALDAGGRACGVLADSLEKTAMTREHRNLLLDGQLTLISPYDPGAGFNVGNAMQRNKLIYALADASLVVNSDFEKGGTWAGALEQLEKLKLVPVYVRSTGKPSVGLDALSKKGALAWPNPDDAAAFEALLSARPPAPAAPAQAELSLDQNAGGETAPTLRPEAQISSFTEAVASAAVGDRAQQKQAPASLMPSGPQAQADDQVPAEVLFAAVRESIRRLLKLPMKDAEVAEALAVTKPQAKEWLQRLVAEGMVEEQKRPLSYVIKPKRLFE